MGRCIADYVRRSIDFKIAGTRKVSPLAQDKKRLDRVIMRSSVFVADMTYITLRSKIQSKHMVRILFGFLVQFWILEMGWFVQRDGCGLQDRKLNRCTVKAKTGSKGGGCPSINYIYKEPDRLLHATT